MQNQNFGKSLTPLSLDQAISESKNGSFVVGGNSQHTVTLTKKGEINNVGTSELQNKKIKNGQQNLVKLIIFRCFL